MPTSFVSYTLIFYIIGQHIFCSAQNLWVRLAYYLETQQQITTSVAAWFLCGKGQILDQYIHSITNEESNLLEFCLCMFARLLNIQISVLLCGDVWTTEHIKDIDICKVIPVYVSHSR